MKKLGFFYVLSSVLGLTLAAVPTGCTKEGLYCLNPSGTNSDVFEILTCKDGNTEVMSKCLTEETCIDNPMPHCAPKSSPQKPLLVSSKPIPTTYIWSITTSDTMLPTPPVFSQVPSTVNDPSVSRTSANPLAARQTQSPFRILIFPEMSMRGKGTSFDTDGCIPYAAIPWPIRSLVVERYFECMFWDRDDCPESASPQQKEGSARDCKIIRDVKFGFEIKSLRCHAVPG